MDEEKDTTEQKSDREMIRECEETCSNEFA
jgi:hypothetical protein